RTAWLENGMITTFDGPYNWARDKWQELQSRMVVEGVEPVVVTKPAKEVKAVNVEEEIATLELTITSLETDMECETDWEKYESLTAEVANLKEQLASYYEQWMREVE